MKTAQKTSSVRTAGLALLMAAFQVSGPAARSDEASAESQLHQAAKTPPPAATATPSITGDYTGQGLRMNFRGAPLNLVLQYLSEAAGFIINKQTEIRGSVEVWSKHPVSKDEAVDLLGSTLKANGYALTRNGRILNILATDSIKTADTEILVNNDPNTVEKSDEVQTQIIPVRYVSATQLTANLQTLLPATASLSPNESANTLILVASKTDIKRMLRIIDALDTSLKSESSIKVFPLRHGDAKSSAELINQLFAKQSASQASGGNRGPNFGNGLEFGGPNFPGGPTGFNGPGFGGPPGSAPNQAASQSGTAQRNSTSPQVIAVADDRSNSVVLRAAPDILKTVEEILRQTDQPVNELTEVRVFHLRHADPTELADQIAQLFPDSDASRNGSDSGAPVFFPGGPPPGGPNTDTTGTASERMKKAGKVLAVPDPRTASLVLSAAKTLMPQLAGMIVALDADEGKREMVGYFELKNADPQDISQNLQDLFNRTGTRQENNNQNTLLGRNHPLTQRQLQNQQATTGTANSGFGSTSANNSGRSGP